MHENIQYSDLTDTQSIAVRRARDIMKSQIKLLAETLGIMPHLNIYLKIKYEISCISNGHNYYFIHTGNIREE